MLRATVARTRRWAVYLSISSLAILVTLVAFLAGCGSTSEQTGGANEGNLASAESPGTSSSGASSGDKVVIRVAGYQGAGGVSTYNPPQVAQKLGYYKNIVIEDSDIPVGSEALAAVTSERIEAAHVPYNVVILGIANGAKVKAVAAAHGAQNTVNWTVYVPKDSPIKSAADLKGKRIGGAIKGDTSYIALVEYLKTANLTINDVTLVDIPMGQAEPPLKTGQVDASASWLDFEQGAIEDTGLYRVLFTIYDTLPKGLHHCGVIFTQKFIDENPEIVREFVDGYVKAWEWMKANPEESLKFHVDLAVKKKLDPTPIKKYTKTFDIRTHALIEDQDVNYYIEKLAEYGQIKAGQVKVSDVYTNEFNSAAKTAGAVSQH